MKLLVSILIFYIFNSIPYIVIPAGILQPPIFHPDLPRAVNMGGIGMIMGHELTHGFDDKGRMYDEFGSISNWWDTDSQSAFRRRADCFTLQYGNYCITEKRDACVWLDR